MKKFLSSELFRPYYQWVIVVFAMTLPFIIIRSYPDFFHGSDVDDFFRWSQAWRLGWQDIYINCDRCNYPILGTFFSGGVMSFINIENFLHLAARFRYYLAVVDAVNTVLILFILIKLKVKHAPLWAGVIGLLPSSWLGSSVWGQIDGLGQCLILLFFILIICFNEKERTLKEIFFFSLISGVLFSLMLLTKQLIYFSLFSLGMIFLANIILVSRNIQTLIYSLLAVSISLFLPAIFIDTNLNLEKSYFSHLQYILITGSSHGEKISSLGMNIWSFFSEDLLSSSRVPILIKIDSFYSFSVVPYFVGIFLFVFISLLLFILFGRYILNMRSSGVLRFDRDTILISLIFLALVNLTFNLTLTGVHERYLYHFYPFVIIACLGWLSHSKYFNYKMLFILLISSFSYGLFLFGYLNSFIKPNSQGVLQGMTTLNLALFFYLIYCISMELKMQILQKHRPRAF